MQKFKHLQKSNVLLLHNAHRWKRQFTARKANQAFIQFWEAGSNERAQRMD